VCPESFVNADKKRAITLEDTGGIAHIFPATLSFFFVPQIGFESALERRFAAEDFSS
jgi:hypothetical protein